MIDLSLRPIILVVFLLIPFTVLMLIGLYRWRKKLQASDDNEEEVKDINVETTEEMPDVERDELSEEDEEEDEKEEYRYELEWSVPTQLTYVDRNGDEHTYPCVLLAYTDSAIGGRRGIGKLKDNNYIDTVGDILEEYYAMKMDLKIPSAIETIDDPSDLDGTWELAELIPREDGQYIHIWSAEIDDSDIRSAERVDENSLKLSEIVTPNGIRKVGLENYVTTARELVGSDNYTPRGRWDVKNKEKITDDEDGENDE